jgi:hypothetical protein
MIVDSGHQRVDAICVQQHQHHPALACADSPRLRSPARASRAKCRNRLCMLSRKG